MQLLEIPWEDASFLKKRFADQLKPRGGSLFVFTGGPLPALLKPYMTEDFSYARWVEDDLRIKNKQSPLPTRRGATVFKPRPHQLEAAKAIFKAHQVGHAGFLLADRTGLGKTLSTLVGITAVAKKDGFGPEGTRGKARILVVCPKGVIPVWRQTLHNYPAASAHGRFLVINYQQLNKLLQTSPAMKAREKARREAAKKAKRRLKARSQKDQNHLLASMGDPTVPWDYVIFDEAHSLKNYGSSNTSLAAASIARLNQPYQKGKSPFVIYSTATPGSSPLNFSLMAPWLSKLLSATATGKDLTPDGFAPFLARIGFAVKKGKVTWSWASNPWFGKDSKDPAERLKYQKAQAEAKAKQRKDAKRIGMALKDPRAPFIMRSPSDIAGWPEQQLIPLPLELSAKARPIYEEAWSTFRTWLRLTPANKDPKGALVQQLRYRQKASLLKVDAMMENIADFVENGNQVYVAVEFMETLDRYKALLEAKNIPVAEISGRNTALRDQERIRFQKGHAKVALCTVVAGISLHAEETLPDGSKATSAPRVTVLHDTRQNPLDTVQALGRAHRDGQNSLSYFPVFEDTVDEQVVLSFVNKQANMKTMMGSSEEEAEALEGLFREAASREG